MRPILFQHGALALPSYGALLLVAFAVGGLVRRSESRRLGYSAQPGYRWVAVGALVGAVLGSKLGMLLYTTPAEWLGVLRDAVLLETSGKTVIGALIGGYAGVEVAKRIVGITQSTGDAFALAVPLSLAIGRVGCFLAGCCFGSPSTGLFAVHMAGADRHPVQLYEAALDLMLAAAIYLSRAQPLRRGDLFKLSLIGYAAIRIAVDPWRGDPRAWLGPISAVQVVCAAAIALLGWAMLRRPRVVDAVA